MENENLENETPTNEGEVDTETTVEDTEDTPKTYSEEEYRKVQELADNYKIRAEKAEKANKPKPTEKKSEFTPKDYIALNEAKIGSDDFETVVDWADFKKLPIHEALKDKTLLTILKDRAEERATASATNTRRTTRREATPAPDQIVSRARQGQLPDTDEGIEELVKAEIDLKRNRK